MNPVTLFCLYLNVLAKAPRPRMKCAVIDIDRLLLKHQSCLLLDLKPLIESKSRPTAAEFMHCSRPHVAFLILFFCLHLMHINFIIVLV